MGKETTAKVTVGSKKAECVVLLEGTEIVIRGELKRKVPRARMKGLAAVGGVLSFEDGGERVKIELGEKAAAAWRDAIENPRSRVEKLGVKAGMTVCVLGDAGRDAVGEVEAVSGSKVSRRLVKSADVVLLVVREVAELETLATVKGSLAESGAVWVLWPKGRKDLRHEEVVAAAKRSGLVQTKSVGFSEELSGLRLVRQKSGAGAT